MGGAHVHCSISGVSDYFANNEIEAFQICRNILQNVLIYQILSKKKIKISLKTKKKAKGKNFHLDTTEIEKPLFPAEELNYIMSPNIKKVVDANYIIARLVDGSKFLEYKKNYGSTLVTGFARLYGQEVGILANNGVIFSESAQKGANFIEICSEVFIYKLI